MKRKISERQRQNSAPELSFVLVGRIDCIVGRVQENTSLCDPNKKLSENIKISEMSINIVAKNITICILKPIILTNCVNRPVVHESQTEPTNDQDKSVYFPHSQRSSAYRAASK